MATSLFWGADDWRDSWFHFYKQVIAIMAWLTACIWVARNAPALFDRLPALIVWTGAVVTAATMAAYFRTSDFPATRMSGLGAIDNSDRRSLQRNTGVRPRIPGRTHPILRGIHLLRVTQSRDRGIAAGS
ncbi:MAG: hypothetical protein IPM40_09125 [Gammaproteobacteria bacterium]|nr:hypothetical protein [Gammaproteobacteria bacterium]